VRLQSNGALDVSFASNGMTDHGANVIKAAPDGTFFISGGLWVTRMFADGTRDPNYFFVSTDPIGDQKHLNSRAFVVQPDGAVLALAVAGTVHTPAESLIRLASMGYTIQVVDAAPPTVTISGDASVNEGSTYTLNLTGVDTDDSVTGWIVNWGDGAAQMIDGNPASANHVYCFDRAGSFGVLRGLRYEVINLERAGRVGVVRDGGVGVRRQRRGG